MRSQYPITVFDEPYSAFSEAYRKLQVNIDLINVDKKFKVLQIVSSITGEGKTVAALNLAAVYAERNEKVLLIDLDLRKPKIHRAFNLENKDGLTDYLLGKISREQLVHKSNRGIDVIIRGQEATYPNVVINSQKFADLIASFRNEYDLIVLDCPPMLAVSDSLAISKLSDGVILVASAGITTVDMLQESLTSLQQNNIKVLGINFVRVDMKKTDYRYYSYHVEK